MKKYLVVDKDGDVMDFDGMTIIESQKTKKEAKELKDFFDNGAHSHGPYTIVEVSLPTNNKFFGYGIVDKNDSTYATSRDEKALTKLKDEINNKDKLWDDKIPYRIVKLFWEEEDINDKT